MPEFIANLRTSYVKTLMRPMANRCNQSSHMTYPHQHLKFETPKNEPTFNRKYRLPSSCWKSQQNSSTDDRTLRRQGTPRGHFGSALVPPPPRRLYPGAHAPAPVLEAPARANRGDFPSGTMDVSWSLWANTKIRWEDVRSIYIFVYV